jgi:hypothetical protein
MWVQPARRLAALGAAVGLGVDFFLLTELLPPTYSDEFFLMDHSPAIHPVPRNGFVVRRLDARIPLTLDDYPKLHVSMSTLVVDKVPRIVFLNHSMSELTSPISSGQLVDPISNQTISTKTPYHYLRPYERDYYEKCSYMQPWQSTFFPTCNQMHELDVFGERVTLLSVRGSWRSVWKVNNENDTLALKMLQLSRDFDQESFGYHQVDAMAMERLASSRFVVNSYGFCGQSVLVEGAPQDARSLIKDETIGSKQRLRIARDLARGLNHIHSIDAKLGANATLVHNDINVANIVNVKSQALKFNDFNLGILLKWNKTKPCGYPVHFRGDLWRSPEEIRSETYVNEMTDIYALGNVLFQVLTRHQPWTWLEPGGRLSIQEVAEKKLAGLMPTFPDKILESPKLAQQAMYFGVRACYQVDPTNRPTAFQLAKGFQQALRWITEKKKPSREELENLFVSQKTVRARLPYQLVVASQ